MQGAVYLSAAVVLWWFATAVAWGDERAPYLFEPIKPRGIMRVVSETEIERIAFQSLSISPDGAYVALARLYGRVDIWSVESGARTAALRLAKGEMRTTAVALLGDPCVAVTATGDDISDDPVRGGERPIEIWECRSGRRVAALRRASEPPKNELIGLTAVPGCGLVVASFAHDVAVIDVASSSLRSDLSELFDGVREAALRTYPPMAGRPLGAIVRFAASSERRDCALVGLVHHYDSVAKTVVPAALYEFDLRARRVRMIRMVGDELLVGVRGALETKFVVSPARKRVAVSVQPLGTAWSGGVITFADLVSDAPPKHFDGRNLWATNDLAFLGEDVLILSTLWAAQNTDAALLDRRSGRRHSLCHTVFGEPDIKKGNPRAVAVNAKLRLLAVSLRDEVRVFRYRDNPIAPWTVRDCVND